ncbi:MAG: hypothetical protein ACM3IJ_02385 [Candidatus Levyibacteriota bacterium]
MIKFIGTTQKGADSLLYYLQPEGKYLFLKAVTSSTDFQNALKYDHVFLMDNKGRDEKSYNWSGFRVAKLGNQYFLTYKETKNTTSLQSAVSTNLTLWEKTGTVRGIKETAAVIPDYVFHDAFVMYYGEKAIKAATSTDLLTWKAEKTAVLEKRQNFFDNGDLETGNAWVIGDHILLTYYVKKDNRYAVGAALFDRENPLKYVWRSDEPIWEQPEELSREEVAPLGAVVSEDQLILYWVIGQESLYTVTCQIPTITTGLKDKVFQPMFKKAENNPIISPQEHRPWESRATFNTAAVYEDGKVHFLYRALGDTDLSVLGYATSSDGIHIDDRSIEPVYIPREPFETPGNNAFKSIAEHFMSGGGYGGVEDPRITKVDDKFYMTYVAFDGANPPRVALTSISVDDFLNKRWDNWEKPKLISAPGMVNKNAVIFPEKIKGKYVVFHRIYPNILVDYVDDLSFENTYLQGHHFIPPRKKFWDSKKIGAGAPPIKTEDGWLFVYQSVGYQDPGKYKIGAMLLDLENPSKVLYRTNSPIVEPVEKYENDGFKAGVVYPCGAVAMNDKLHVYYGGADTVVCAASADLSTFLKEMKHNQEPKLRKIPNTLFN